jgi:sugar phosphate isomerase/epimerase
VSVELREAARRAADVGLRLAIENHQDFTSAELVEFCDSGGQNVGVCFDCGNALSVAEDPVAFAHAVKGRTFHVHVKDYRAQFTDEGYRLVRCPIGEGAVDFVSIFRVLEEGAGENPPTAAIECGALNARHIRLLTRQGWRHYPARSEQESTAAMRAACVNRLDEGAEWRTPWEIGDSCDAIVAYEMEQLKRSVANLQGLGLM